MKKVRVGILGATGMVGQRFVTLLANHPWFEISCLAASPRSQGKRYEEAVMGRWNMKESIPHNVQSMHVLSVANVENVASSVDAVFSALDMEKEEIRRIEELYASHNIPVVSNNSAHRWTSDVPMIMPEVNAHHLELITAQRKKRGWKKGCIVVKPNCSIQSYVSILTALSAYQPLEVSVTSLQAVSGAGKTFDTWLEMRDNVIPFIGGEEEKSEKEPMKIWGTLENDTIRLATKPVIAATCIRVPVSDGHMVSVSVRFRRKPTKKEILESIKTYPNPLSQLNLPSSPHPFMTYFEEETRPQTRLDRENGHGMGITFGRLREDPLFHWKFVALSHNTVRGAAGGAVLVAELMKAKGYI